MKEISLLISECVGRGGIFRRFLQKQKELVGAIFPQSAANIVGHLQTPLQKFPTCLFGTVHPALTFSCGSTPSNPLHSAGFPPKQLLTTYSARSPGNNLYYSSVTPVLVKGKITIPSSAPAVPAAKIYTEQHRERALSITVTAALVDELGAPPTSESFLKNKAGRVPLKSVGLQL